MKNILVAIDSCEATTIASPLLERTIEVAKAFSSKVWVLHVAPHMRQIPYNVDNRIIRKQAATELHSEHDFLQQLAKCMRDRDIEAHALLVEGATVETILHESDRLDIDLVIVGCHRHSELYGALMSGTEEGLLGKCRHPIMFVPILE